MMTKDCFTDPPSEPGSYNVSIHNVMSFMPIFWYFDGTNWDTRSFLMEPLGPNMAIYWPETKQEGYPE